MNTLQVWQKSWYPIYHKTYQISKQVCLHQQPNQFIFLQQVFLKFFEIKKLLVSLKPKNSSGINEIPTTVLKTTPDNILYALTYVFNLSMLNGKFITSFKTAKVIPIFKKGYQTIVSISYY